VNSAAEGFTNDADRVTLKSNGQVSWLPRATYSVKFLVDVTFYPFDQQNILIRFTTWQYSADQVNVSGTGLVLEGVPDQQWEMNDISSSHIEYIFGGTLYRESHIKMNIKRRPLFHVMALLLPAAMLSVLSLLVYWVPPESGERLSMAVTLLLSYTMFLLLVYGNIPQTSLTIPIIGESHTMTCILMARTC
jgi:nicotinic acetylcholine receptor